LERALLISLLAEEERLHAMMVDAKSSMSDHESIAGSKASSSEEPAESKGGGGEKESAVSVASSKGEGVKRTPKKLPSTLPSASLGSFGIFFLLFRSFFLLSPFCVGIDAFADIKPLKLKSELKPLPSIKSLPNSSGGGGGSFVNPQELAQDLYEKKKLTEATLKKGQEQLAGQRRNEEELKKQLDPSEIERREKHMKEQRDLLIAKKKAEREKKVQQEEERKRKANSENSDEKEGGSSQQFSLSGGDRDAKGNSSSSSGGGAGNEEMAEMRRATMRMALARRLKMDLLESEESKRNEQQENQFIALDKKLQQVEQLREDNRKREYILNKQVEKQQEQIARNIELSAAHLSKDR
jgi:hypothetical protein